jgi:CheY-like chemotaxis protein
VEEKMKSYTKFVSQHEVVFDTQFKIAMDLAQLLDGDCLVVPSKEERNFSADQIALLRIRVLENLRSIAGKHGVEPPPMEQGLFEGLVPTAEQDKKLSELVDSVYSEAMSKVFELPNLESKLQVVQLLDVIVMMPTLLSEYRGPNVEQTLGLLNSLLMKLGVEPRAMYSLSDFSFGSSIPAPNRELRLLIVDDDPLEIARSYFALVGSPNTVIESFRVEHEELESSEEIEERLKFIAQDVLRCKPDIVLMDQGMPPFKGSDLICAIHDVSVNRDIYFVGNTGGSLHELEQSGAHGNFAKGRDPGCILRAFRYFT